MERKEIKKLISSAVNAEKRKRRYVDELMDRLESIVGDMEIIPCEAAENTDNLKSAILCHINYDEYELNKLLDDIEKAISEAENREDEKNAKVDLYESYAFGKKRLD